MIRSPILASFSTSNQLLLASLLIRLRKLLGMIHDPEREANAFSGHDALIIDQIEPAINDICKNGSVFALIQKDLQVSYGKMFVETVAKAT